MKPLRILIADDHTVVRRGLRALLEAQPGWEVCGEAINGREAVDKALRLLAEGHGNKQVAGTLTISVRTVESHRARIMRKLALKSFSALVRYAIRAKIITP